MLYFPSMSIMQTKNTANNAISTSDDVTDFQYPTVDISIVRHVAGAVLSLLIDNIYTKKLLNLMLFPWLIFATDWYTQPLNTFSRNAKKIKKTVI